MAKLSTIRTDAEKVENGQWVKYSSGVELLVASIQNAQYRKERARLLSPRMCSMRRSSMSPDEVTAILKPAVARCVLLGWRNIEDDKGKPIEYSPEKALEFFNDDSLRDLYDFVLEVAAEIESFRQDDLGGKGKNSQTASDGS